MKNLSEADQILVSRFTSERLTGQELADFERRLLREPVLRASVDEQREVQDWFAHVRASESVSPGADVAAGSPGFVEGVMHEARRRSPVEQSGVEELGETQLRERSVIRTARALLVAAALVLGLSLLIAGGVLRPGDGDRLSADPDRVEQIDRQMQLGRSDAERRAK